MQQDAYVAALLSERAGYERHGRTDRVADVDAELARLGVTRQDAHHGQERAVRTDAQTRRRRSR